MVFWFYNFGSILTLSNVGFPCISGRTHGVKFCMLLYLDHLQNWLDYGQSLALFWLSEVGQIWGFRPFWSCSVDFPHYGAPLTETSHIWGFWASCGERVGINVEWGAEAYFRRFASSSVLFNLIKTCVLYWKVTYCEWNIRKQNLVFFSILFWYIDKVHSSEVRSLYKNIARHPVYTMVSWFNPKQWRMIPISISWWR